MKVAICAGCQKALIGPYISALGKRWHRHCFRCQHCGQLITEQGFTIQGGKSYHANCHKLAFGIKCAVCEKFIEGAYIKDFWGNTYCAHHRDDPNYICYACNRPINRTLAQGYVRYPDGRVMCDVCRATAVDDNQRAAQVLAEVQKRMRRYDLDTDTVTIPLQMISVTTMNQQGITVSAARLQGLTQTRTVTRNGSMQRQVKAVTVLRGLPQEQFAGVLAHELGHVWLFVQEIDKLPRDLEEGLCNLFAYLLHQEKTTPDARYCIHLLENNPDSVYGDGFRRAKGLYENKGLPWLLNAVRAQRDWPALDTSTNQRPYTLVAELSLDAMPAPDWSELTLQAPSARPAPSLNELEKPEW